MPTFGPPTTNRFGKPATVVQRWARGLPSQCSERSAPSRPLIDLHPREVGHLEAGAEDDRVDLALGALRADDGAAADLGQPLGVELDVVLASAG